VCLASSFDQSPDSICSPMPIVTVLAESLSKMNSIRLFNALNELPPNEPNQANSHHAPDKFATVARGSDAKFFNPTTESCLSLDLIAAWRDVTKAVSKIREIEQHRVFT